MVNVTSVKLVFFIKVVFEGKKNNFESSLKSSARGSTRYIENGTSPSRHNPPAEIGSNRAVQRADISSKSPKEKKCMKA